MSDFHKHQIDYKKKVEQVILNRTVQSEGIKHKYDPKKIMIFSLQTIIYTKIGKKKG